MYPITFFPNLRAVDRPTSYVLTWDEIVNLFSTHVRAKTKDTVPGFGPYEIVPPPGPCYHSRGVVTGPHRCDACVTHLSLAVFDVDIGTPAQVQACEDWLEESGTARLWYSSFSFDPSSRHPSLRLVLPLSRPVPGEHWSSFREAVIRRFQVPADPTKCGGRSHFYYVPSCPPDSDPLVMVGPGKPLDVDLIPVVFERGLSQRSIVEKLSSWSPDEGEPGPVDLSEFHERILKSADRQGRRSDPESKERARALRALVEGKPLAEKGSRDVTTSRVAMSVVGILPDANLHELEVLFRPSLIAMINAGSSLTPESVRRKLVSALRKKAEKELREKELEGEMTRILSEIPTLA